MSDTHQPGVIMEFPGKLAGSCSTGILLYETNHKSIKGLITTPLHHSWATRLDGVAE